MTVKNNFYRHLHFFLVLVLLLVSINIILIPPQLQAYKSLFEDPVAFPKLPGSATGMFIFYEHLDNTLGIQNSNTLAIHAINQWNEASRYTMFDLSSAGPVTESQNRIVAQVFAGSFTQTPCSWLTFLPPGTKAMGCPGNISVYLNSDSQYAWNTSGLHDTLSSNWNIWCFCYPEYVDFSEILLHEIGHVFGLGHPSNSSTSVMNSSGAEPFTQTLTEDDRRGVTQIYGPLTGFETSYTLNWFLGYTYANTLGLENVPAYGNGVTSPQLVRVSAESVAPYNVIPYRGSRQLKLYGVANSNYSYVYMKLFRATDDEAGSNSRHLTITNGMTLSWRQFNHAQARISVDIDFADGTTLRDSGLKDQNNITVHPAGRGVYGTGLWRYFTVNLSPLAGKRVKDILIAYDNGNNGVTGVVRAYFDNIEIN